MTAHFWRHDSDDSDASDASDASDVSDASDDSNDSDAVANLLNFTYWSVPTCRTQF
jgi:hypothetical protein